MKAQIASEKLLIYSKEQCPFCVKAKKLLKDCNPTVVELSSLADGVERQATLKELTGQQTVPNIFIGGHHIGGHSDLVQGIKDGKV